MNDAITVINAGSSSIKFSLFAARGDDLALDCRGQIEGIYTRPHFIAKDAIGQLLAEKVWDEGSTLDHARALEHLIGFLRGELRDYHLAGVGHRVVHGGLAYTQPVKVDAQVLARLEDYVPLAPLHQPHNLAPIRSLLASRPELPQVACFDTSFHRTNPDIAQRFAIPAELHDAGVRRYGFHGLSYEYIAAALAKLDAKVAAGRVIVLHLGNGASMCALQGGRSIASTMGFTAVEGLPMGTRCGTLDPGVMLYLMDERGMDVRAIERLIYNQSGLLGVSGVSSDMRELLASDDPRAALAVDLYLYRIRREMGSLAAALGGVDAIVFTAGIGENAAAIRERVLADAAWLGVRVSVSANRAIGVSANRAIGAGARAIRGVGPRISSARSRVSAWVIPTNEELMIARHTRRILSAN